MILEKKNQLMFVGAGTKGIEPLIFQVNGTPMRGFLKENRWKKV